VIATSPRPYSGSRADGRFPSEGEVAPETIGPVLFWEPAPRYASLVAKLAVAKFVAKFI
jgi:hypothetical protein